MEKRGIDQSDGTKRQFGDATNRAIDFALWNGKPRSQEKAIAPLFEVPRHKLEGRKWPGWAVDRAILHHIQPT